MDAIPPGPQIGLQVLRCRVSTRPGLWLRTMSPSLTHDPAPWCDSHVAHGDMRMRDCMSDIACAPSLSAMPRGFVPRSLAPLVALASPRPCPLAMQHTMHHGLHHGPMSLACSPLHAQSHSPLPILPPGLSPPVCCWPIGVRDAHATTNPALTALEGNLNQLAPPTPLRP